jgi:hypothetical protein
MDKVVTPHAIEQIEQLAGGSVLPRCLHALANIGIADALGDTPQDVAALAAATGVNADALSRVLRLLSANGVFAYRDGFVSHTDVSRLLRVDHPQSMRPLVRMLGLAHLWSVIGEMEYSVRTGAAADAKVLPGGVWGYLSENAEASRIFDEAMTAKAYAQVAGVTAAYDFSGFKVVGDIGGGKGHLLQAVLKSVPDARGILFDQAHVIHSSAASSDRLTLQAGDFFTDDLPSCDAYLLMDVIHDWDDAHATKILRQVRAAAPANARVLVIEAIVPEDPHPSWCKTLDIWMLAIGGKQRTLREHSALLGNAGFEFTRAIDTRMGASIIEGVRTG